MTPPQITLNQVDQFLNQELRLEARDISTLKPGAWSSAYSFTTESGAFVIRFSHHGDDFARDAYAHRFATNALPIPRVVHRDRAFGVHVAISEQIPGEFLDDLNREDFRSTLPSLIRALDAMRTADVASSTGYGTWDIDGNGKSSSWAECLRLSVQDNPDFRGGSWRGKLESSPTGAVAFDRDVHVLERLLRDVPNARNVVHSDLINFNAFTRNHCLTGVIDWGCAMYGDFVYELAWFHFWSPWYPQWSAVNVADEACRYYQSVGADLHLFQERLVCYQIHIGLTHQIYNASIGNWGDLAAVTRLTTSLADKVR